MDCKHRAMPIWAMARTDPQINIRLPALLKARLEAAAQREGRSLTAVIVQRLEASFPSLAEQILEARAAELRAIDEELRATKVRVDELEGQKRAGFPGSGQSAKEADEELSWYRQQLVMQDFLKDRLSKELAAIKKKLSTAKA